LPAFLLSYFVLSDREHIFAGVWARFFPAFVVAGVAIWLMRKHIGFRPRLNGAFYRRALGYGWRANVNSTLTWLNHRIDLFLMLPLLISIGGLSAKEAAAQVAFYSLAVTLAELIWYVPDALRDLLFSKVAGLPKREARAFTPVVCRNALLVCVLAGGALFAVHDFAFGIFLGDDWARWSGDVTPSFAILLVGTAAFTLAKIIQSDLAARGRINTCIGLGSIVLVSMTLLDLFLVPQLGAVGAATGSSIAYVLSAIVSVIVYVRGSRVRISQLLIPHSEDREQWRDLIQSLRARFGPKPKAHATKAP
jgi:O-antigen/teichoic acid export membrane protein